MSEPAVRIRERDEQAREALADGLEDWELATQTLAAIQGGLLLTQLRRDPGKLRIAVDSALDLIRVALDSASRKTHPDVRRPEHALDRTTGNWH